MSLGSYAPTDEPYSVDGVTFYKDPGSTEVIHKDAKLFCFTKPINHNVFWYKTDNPDLNPLSSLQRGWEKGSPYRAVSSLSGEIEHWTQHQYTFPPEAIAPYLPDIAVAGARAHWHGDVQGTVYGLLVSEKAKVIIDDLDPDGSYFFPMSLTIQETGEPLGGAHFYWKPRREFRFQRRKGADIGGKTLDTPFAPGSAFWDAQIAWELSHNVALRHYLQGIPFWTLNTDNGNFGMSPEVFGRLKAEGLTGLIEIVGENYNAPDFDRNSNVGHF